MGCIFGGGGKPSLLFEIGVFEGWLQRQARTLWAGSGHVERCMVVCARRVDQSAQGREDIGVAQ
jgi:hypothetical protein